MRPRSEAEPGYPLLSPPQERWPGAAGTTDQPGGLATIDPVQLDTHSRA